MLQLWDAPTFLHFMTSWLANPEEGYREGGELCRAAAAFGSQRPGQTQEGAGGQWEGSQGLSPARHPEWWPRHDRSAVESAAEG